MESCPRCGSTDTQEMRYCPLANGQPVCVKNCCSSCKHYHLDNYGQACRYWISDEAKQELSLYSIEKLRETLKGE